jgi:uncharacterized protein (UPF0332 family)
MFYVAGALLHEKGIRARSHSGIRALFGQHFAKPGLMDSKYHRWLLGAFDRRPEGDYGFTVAITQEDLEAMIGQAREFLDRIAVISEISPPQPLPFEAESSWWKGARQSRRGLVRFP